MAKRLLVLLCLLSLGSCDDSSVVPPNATTPCPLLLSILVPEGEYELLPSGELAHGDSVYPASAHWKDADGSLRACVCLVAAKPCVRKCCPAGAVLRASFSPKMFCESADPEDEDDGSPMLLEPRRVSPLIREQLDSKPSLQDWYSLIEPGSPLQLCRGNLSILPLEPRAISEDSSELQPDGSLLMPLATPRQAYGSEDFCVDHRRLGPANVTELAVVVCMRNVSAPGLEVTTAVKIGYVISVPFFAVTFIVYAIIPELRNIYGKTLMCYVFALLSAYSSLSAANIAANSDHYLAVCHIIDKQDYPTKRSDDCGDYELFSSCGPTCERNCDDINNDDVSRKSCVPKDGCIEKCVCKEGYVRDNFNGKCIRMQECPRVRH